MKVNNDFNVLDENVKLEVLSVLKCYDVVHVTAYNGEFHVSPHTMIFGEYPTDYKNIGTFKANDIYTEQERVDNYKSSFGCNPPPNCFK